MHSVWKTFGPEISSFPFLLLSAAAAFCHIFFSITFFLAGTAVTTLPYHFMYSTATNQPTDEMCISCTRIHTHTQTDIILIFPSSYYIFRFMTSINSLSSVSSTSNADKWIVGNSLSQIPDESLLLWNYQKGGEGREHVCTQRQAMMSGDEWLRCLFTL